ncbi:methyl-accepting chemotaxis protein [Phytohalomonas tamaricis]|uniref:methyl-accepting chemotaxis protein n=1 Tax=Phytohalomonas tamaricis TaxID=2081032 RepID=UPI000D0B23D7|nr:methyl-accepting chemotaxis protein [Phytohalomonas tamaricis]
MMKQSVKARLTFTLAVCGILISVIGAIGAWGLGSANRALGQVYENNVLPMEVVSSLRSAALELSARMLDPIRLPSPSEVERLEAEVSNYQARNESLWERYLEMIPAAGEERKQAQQLQADHKAFNEGVNEFMTYLRGGQYFNAGAFYDDTLLVQLERLRDDLNALVEQQRSEALSAYQQGQQDYQLQRLAIFSLIGIALIVLIIVGTWLVRGILRPLEQARYLADRIANGHLDGQIEIHARDEFGDMLHSLSAMNSRLYDIVSQARHSAHEVNSAALTLSSANSDLAQRTQTQTASLEETASSMEQMTATVRQNADNAHQADQLTTSMRDQAVAGGDVIERAVAAMAEINASSQQIASIVSLIEGIAFQTNLLALNAAVEAARAGEQGRGFAVVAGEVRQLAERSSSAAKEIKTLIDDSATRVENGGALVRQSGETLSSLVTSIRRSSSIISEIAVASREQSSGIEQVNTAITQLDDIAQRNAVLVDDAASASQLLTGQASALLAQMAFFRLESDASQRVASKPLDVEHDTDSLPAELTLA